MLTSNLLVQPYPYICRDDIKQMNTSNLKSYAPNARQQFISAIRNKLQSLGITEKNITEAVRSGDFLIIQGSNFPLNIESTRNQLVRQIEVQGFEQVVEQAAYTWFNRLCAIRFMELHEGYLEHGYRVLSHPERSSGFQILDHAMDVVGEFGLDEQQIIHLKLDSSQEETLYRTLLLAQCAQLHQAMPFLFDEIDSVTSLLLPDYLSRTDSIIYSLVQEVPEEDWQQVESIGWLYQFYISEKKDQVIGSVVKSEDIPAATQLFTPNWIVKYMVQNSLGRYWLQTYPDSLDKTQLEYYIEPAEQSPEVIAQLKGITPDSIDPLSIKVIDPACGSGHILVEAYNLLKRIYEYRGERSRDIPALILNNNLFGLDIDDRAAQLTGFALMMMARADDRRIFSRDIKLNVCAMQNSDRLNAKQLWRDLNLNGAWKAGSHDDMFGSEQIDLSSDEADTRYQLIHDAIERFHQAKTFGSLIDVPLEQEENLKELKQKLAHLLVNGDTLQKPAAILLLPIIEQAWILSLRYDAVIANPPYMGSNGINENLKVFINHQYKNAKVDLFSCFIEKSICLSKQYRNVSVVAQQSWMFLSSFEKFRFEILNKTNIDSLVHIGYNSFPELNSKIVQCAMFSLTNGTIDSFVGSYVNLNKAHPSSDKNKVFLERDALLKHQISQREFYKIPGATIAYWATQQVRDLFEQTAKLEEVAKPKTGLNTGNNDYFLKNWHELSFGKIHFGIKSSEEALLKNAKWIPYNKGGDFRRWFGNNELVVNWENDGQEIKEYAVERNQGKHWSRFVQNTNTFFKEGITWSFINFSRFAVRYKPVGFIYDVQGTSSFPQKENLYQVMALLCSKVGYHFLSCLNPTLSFQAGNIASVPFVNFKSMKLEELVSSAIQISKNDWDQIEQSWEFSKNAILNFSGVRLESCVENYKLNTNSTIVKLANIESEINKICIDAYDLDVELSYLIEPQDVTLTCNPHYRYGGDATNAEYDDRFQSDTMAELISYAIGCMMGRYSLDREGLIYAHAGNACFKELVDEGAYNTFSADDDGILPILDEERFPDDVCVRLVEFVRTVWDEQTLLANLDYIAESLRLYNITAKNGEGSIDTIRRYLSNHFFKDHHLRSYKNRPIYWLFSSGKNKAFECLVYLHRMNESTLPRMRTEYVLPLLSQFSNRIGSIDAEMLTASTIEKTRLSKEKDSLVKKHTELQVFDAELKHHIEQKIVIDLDDGVKENYRKFAKLLAEVKKVTGSA